MKTWHIILLLFALAISFMAGYHIREISLKAVPVKHDTIVDTLRSVLPVPSFEVEVGGVEIPYPIIIKEKGQERVDTVYIPVPVTQKEYKTDDYHLRISGYKSNLDYIEVYRRTEQITKVIKPKCFGVGVVAGYGIGKHGLSPYVGIGGYYRIW